MRLSGRDFLNDGEPNKKQGHRKDVRIYSYCIVLAVATTMKKDMDFLNTSLRERKAKGRFENDSSLFSRISGGQNS